MRWRALLLVVLGLALVSTPAFVYPNGGQAVYAYELDQQEHYRLEQFADRGEYANCWRFGTAPDGTCSLVRYAHDHDGIVVADTDLDVPEAIGLVDGNRLRRYWVETTTTENGTRLTVERVDEDNYGALYELVATPVDHLPQAARAALDGTRVTVTGDHPPGEYAYLVRQDGEWVRLDRVKLRGEGVPPWAELVRVVAPPVGGVLLGLVAAGRRVD